MKEVKTNGDIELVEMYNFEEGVYESCLLCKVVMSAMLNF